MSDQYDPDASAADLGQAKVAVTGSTLGTIKSGARVCRVSEGLIVAHPDDPPYLIRWCGKRVDLEITKDGAIVLPPAPGIDLLTVNLTVTGFLESVGFDSAKWLTREQQLIEDLRAAVSQNAVGVTFESLHTLCRRALDVLEDLT